MYSLSQKKAMFIFAKFYDENIFEIHNIGPHFKFNH
jgi:hypothetical protein